MKYDLDRYPYQHYLDGNPISIDEACAELKNFNTKTDKTFNVKSPSFTMIIDQVSRGQTQWNAKTPITDRLAIECTVTSENTKDIDIKEYVNDFQKDLNSHMTACLEKFSGPFVLLNSGGIDCTVMGAWLYKNKIDFEVLNLIDLPYGSEHTEIQSARINEEWKKLGVKTNTMDSTVVTKHERMMRYMTRDFTRNPKCFDDNCAGYDNYLKEYCDGKIAMSGNGSNLTMLHIPKGIGHAYASLDWDNYKKFIHTDTFSQSGMFDLLVQTRYHDGRKPVDAQGMMEHNFFDNSLPRMTLSMGYRPWRHILEQVPCWEAILFNYDWYKKFESINYDNLTLELMHELMECTHWRNIIEEWTNKDLASKVKTTQGDNSFYHPNTEVKQYCQNSLIEMKNYWKGNWPMLKEILAMEYVLNRFNRITSEMAQLIHFFNWRKNSN